MNRHSPAFRIAFFSLLFAIALPLLVFVAAQVRHRQLQSRANPRWAAFAAVNGSRVESTNTPIIKPANQSKSSAALTIPAQLASQSNGLTGSATDSTRWELPLTTGARPVAPPGGQNRPAERPRPLFSVTPTPPSLSSSRVLNPLQDEIPRTDRERSGARDNAHSSVMTSQPDVQFRAMNDNEDTSAAGSRLDSRLAEMQRRLDQLAQLQVEKKVTDLDHIASLLEQLQAANQKPTPRPFESASIDSLPPTRFPNGGPELTRTPTPRAVTTATPLRESGTITNAPGGREPSIRIIQGDLGDDDERFSIHVQEANLAEVLEMLGQLAGVNILTSREVQGRVSLNLQDVTVDRALAAILKSQGFVFERDGDIIYVRTAAEAEALRQLNRKAITKVYQPHHIGVSEFQKLVTPVLTAGVGRAAVTSPSTDCSSSRQEAGTMDPACASTTATTTRSRTGAAANRSRFITLAWGTANTRTTNAGPKGIAASWRPSC